MKELIYLLVFFLCLAFAAGAILLSQKLKISQQADMFESLFYYVILLTFFGYYAIWGQVIINRIMQFLSATSEVFFVVGQLIPLMGFPFLVMGGYMLIRFGHELWGKKVSRPEQAGYFIFYLLLLATFGWLSFQGFDPGNVLEESPLTLLILFFLIQEIVIHGWFLLIQARQVSAGHLTYSDRAGIFMLIMLVLLIIRMVALTLLFLDTEHLAPVFIFVFFMSLTIPVFYLYRHHNRILQEVQPGMSVINSREKILRKNGITKREGEIIELICKGNTNQEIADSLFISLQTVKDHTHRIYLKLEVRNRMQLINLLQNH